MILNRSIDIFLSELRDLSNIKAGLHYAATRLSQHQVETFDLPEIARKYHSIAPSLWRVTGTLLTGDSEENGDLQSREDAEYEEDMLLEDLVDLAAEEESDAMPMDNTSPEDRETTKKLLRQRIQRDEILRVKTVTIMSICANSMNRRCNAFQIINSLFLNSVNATERVHGWGAHAGLCVSDQSAANLIDSLSKEMRTNLIDVCRTDQFALAYDNVDFSFQNPEPTATKQGSFRSMTSGTFIEMPWLDPEILRCSKELWETNPYN
ncbi:hypothetical protein SISNIDRAFT_408737, partial [Sistotremastrum niveocremeum HHB9708]